MHLVVVAVAVACSLGLSLVAGCQEPQVLYSEQVFDQSSQAQAATLIPRHPHVCLRIGEGFSPAEQDLILAAVAHENLRADVQFDFAPLTSDTPRPGSWTLLKRLGAAPADAALVTERFSQGGGAIGLDIGRLAAGDLHKAIVGPAGIVTGADLRCRGADALHQAAAPLAPTDL